MKKILSLALALVLTVLLIPTNVEAAEAKEIKLNKSKMTIYVGAKTTLTNTGTAKNIKWSSTKPAVASVSKKGVITAKKAGKTTIIAKSGKTTAKCTVTVKKALKVKQIIKKVDSQFKNIKNITINAYMQSVSKKNLYMGMGVNLKTKVMYMNIPMFGLPEMYIEGKKVYWNDVTTNTWFYYTMDSDDSFDYVDTEELLEGIDENGDYKLVGNKNFNGKRCAVLSTKINGVVAYYYFDLADYSLVGAVQGKGKEKTIMIVDIKTTVDIPVEITSAEYKEFTYDFSLDEE